MTYIPRSSLVSNTSQGAIPKVVQKRRTFRVFGFLAGVLITGSLLSAAGTFLYQEYALKQLASVKEALNKESADDNARDIAEISAFNARLNTAHDLLSNHIAPSQVLSHIEKITKETVQLTQFKYTYDPGFDVFLEIGGATSELSSVALQKIELLKAEMFTKFVVNDITVGAESVKEDTQKKEQVQFGIKGTLEKQLFAYNGAGKIPDTIAELVTEEATSTDASTIDNEVTP